MSQKLLPGAESGKLHAVYAQERDIAPMPELTYTLGLYLSLLLFVLIRGGKGIPSVLGLTLCSGQYWAFTLGFTVLCVGVVGWLGKRQVQQYQEYSQINYQWEADDVVWTPGNCLKYAFSALFAAIGMGLLSVTGGLFVAPLLYAYGLRPEVTVATCSVLSFFTSSISFLQFSAAGMVNYEYGVFLATASVLGSLLGVTQIEHFQRSSLLVHLLGLVFALATCLMATFGAIKVANQWTRQLIHSHFNSFC